MNCEKEFLNQLIQTNTELIEDTIQQNDRDFDNSKLWIKQTFNNLFNLLPKEELDRDICDLLSLAEQEALITDPLLAIEFFQNKYHREIFNEDWEHEISQHQTPPKKQMIKEKIVTQNINVQTGFRKKPATNIQLSSKKQIQSSLKNKQQKKFF